LFILGVSTYFGISLIAVDTADRFLRSRNRNINLRYDVLSSTL